MIGKEKVIWRFDPLIITPNIAPRDLLTRIWHIGNKLKGYTNKLSKEEITVVYCYNEQCHLGIEACLILVEYGYPAMLLEGGFRTWTEDFRFATTN